MRPSKTYSAYYKVNYWRHPALIKLGAPSCTLMRKWSLMSNIQSYKNFNQLPATCALLCCVVILRGRFLIEISKLKLKVDHRFLVKRIQRTCDIFLKIRLLIMTPYLLAGMTKHIKNVMSVKVVCSRWRICNAVVSNNVDCKAKLPVHTLVVLDKRTIKNCGMRK